MSCLLYCNFRYNGNVEDAYIRLYLVPMDLGTLDLFKSNIKYFCIIRFVKLKTIILTFICLKEKY